MASAWGASWGVSWGVSWGLTSPAPVQRTGGVDLELYRRGLFPQPSRTREWVGQLPRRVRRAVERTAERPAQARAIVREALPDIDDVERALEALEMMQARQLRTLQALREALDRDEAIRREQDEEEEVSLIFSML